MYPTIHYKLYVTHVYVTCMDTHATYCIHVHMYVYNMIHMYTHVHIHTQVLDEYLKRGGDAVRTNFIQVKGFHLLANQLKMFKVSFELMSALCGIIIGKDISLKRDQ